MCKSFCISETSRQAVVLTCMLMQQPDEYRGHTDIILILAVRVVVDRLFKSAEQAGCEANGGEAGRRDEAKNVDA